MTNKFFTGDHHFNDKDALLWRPHFLSLDEMAHTMIENWNAVCNNGSLVYHLGDFVITGLSKKHVGIVDEIVSQLNGQIILITGNHDSSAVKSLKKFNWVGGYKHVSIGRQRMILSHFPYLTWHFESRGSWNIHGHCHGNIPDFLGGRARVDAGVDNSEKICGRPFSPVSFEELGTYVKQNHFPKKNPK